eukprot:TRINITY_DN4545_c0_g4_i1.p2 TRINITY_DN4545_c0_g4~~TRINITY_DN4545_c0_g4_i1.p2  ORF type:complete len:119 (-),score=36.43 TRINITY_DN4545_c0_g4_i1:13-369(-)
MVAEKEAKELKKVKKVHNEAEYHQFLKEAKEKNQLVLIDWFAVWCGPCMDVAPAFADLSEEHPQVLFLKIDVEELPELTQEQGVQCMPTFHFIKGGEKMASIQGAHVPKLRELLEKHK